MLKKLTITLLVLLLPAYAISGFYDVEPDETAVTYIFGKMIDKNVEAGIHWNVPYPFGRQVVKQTKANLILSVGKNSRQSDMLTFGARKLWMTGGASLVQIEVDIQYTISRLDLFETSFENPEYYLDLLAQKMLTRSLVEREVDDILTTGRQLLGSEIEQKIQAELDNANTGIQVQDVIVTALSPPENNGVAEAFQLVQNANSDRYRTIEQAQTERNQMLFDAEAEANRIQNEGLADRFTRIETARGDAARFSNLADEWVKSPSTMENRIYLEEMAEILNGVKVYVVPDKGSQGDSVNVLGRR